MIDQLTDTALTDKINELVADANAQQVAIDGAIAGVKQVAADFGNTVTTVANQGIVLAQVVDLLQRMGFRALLSDGTTADLTVAVLTAPGLTITHETLLGLSR